MTKDSPSPEPTLDMCEAFMIATGWGPKDRARWRAYLKKHIGTPGECAFVAGLRAALMVGAGLPLKHVQRQTGRIRNSRGLRP